VVLKPPCEGSLEDRIRYRPESYDLATAIKWGLQVRHAVWLLFIHLSPLNMLARSNLSRSRIRYSLSML
jgi:hypothetical protein